MRNPSIGNLPKLQHSKTLKSGNFLETLSFDDNLKYIYKPPIQPISAKSHLKL
jgi:hypothetical protein